MSPVPSHTMQSGDQAVVADPSTVPATTASRPEGGIQALPSDALDFAAKVNMKSSLFPN